MAKTENERLVDRATRLYLESIFAILRGQSFILTDNGLPVPIPTQFVEDVELGVEWHGNVLTAEPGPRSHDDMRRIIALAAAHMQMSRKNWTHIPPVRKAVAAALARLYSRPIDHGWTTDDGVKMANNTTVCQEYLEVAGTFFTRQEKERKDAESDQAFMREVEEFADIPEQGADDFRRTVLATLGAVAARGESINYKRDLPVLWRAAGEYAVQNCQTDETTGLTLETLREVGVGTDTTPVIIM